MTERIKEQILAIRESGVTNMFNVDRVKDEAYERGFYELVAYLICNKTKYIRFILTGETEETD